MTQVDLNQQANRRETILFGLIILVLLVLFLRMVYGPQAARLDEAKTKYQSLTFEKDALEKFSHATPVISRRDTLTRRGIKMKILYGEVTSVYQDVTSLLDALTAPSFLSGVTIKKLSYQPEVLDKGFGRTDFSMDLLGSFPDVIQYLDRLEQFPALFNLESLSFKTAEGQSRELQINLQGRVYKMGVSSSETQPIHIEGAGRSGGAS